MNKPHKHAVLIKAWADGAEIQSRANHMCEWHYQDEPSWDIDREYRIKPKTIKFRNALISGYNKSYHVFSCNNHHENVENTFGFVRWLGDWQEVEV